ncbi:uncharacterized protein N0V89_006553 [Didymosphaeria variabile]|uniref:AB hydrolase-1 domain-containing protein n=1 Tax=Didymosphaeria variabile TaxID=1932322 RepID=A0A9W8XHJ3_9PLEO|nr:uncharacterized protein N0V89_006553 [Didymosphaeria variabile]KAJ4351214.1 hypothetical protein N0V89_006553 [Didymosphaeria variabile]
MGISPTCSSSLATRPFPPFCPQLAPRARISLSRNVTAEDDKNYIINNMLLPILDHEEHDVILLTHSYSSIPGSAAVAGLSKAERTKEGKKTGVLGQIMLAALLAKGGDGKSVKDAFGGHFPPHIRPDPEASLLRCDDRIPPLYNDIAPAHAAVVAVSAMAQGMTAFTSPCPRASWDSEAYRGRVGFVRTTQDACIPVQVQQMMLDGTGVEWIVKDVESAHNAQISKPEELTRVLVELAEVFEKL